MALRKQKKGGQKSPWSLEELAIGLENFHKEHGRYPTAPEVDTYPYLPSARQIERRFGGLIELRKTLKLNTDSDFRTGSHSSDRAHAINKRSHKVENDVYEFLIKKFGKEFVHREYFFSDDKRTRADFFIYDKGKGFCIDVFYPKDRRNLTGCLNSKLAKYQTDHMRQYPVIFLQMNAEIGQEILNALVRNKDKKLSRGQQLMSWETFQQFCKNRNPLKLAG